MDKKGSNKPGIIKIILVIMAILAQLIVLVYIVELLRQNTVYVYLFLEVLAIVIVILMVSRNRSSSYTIAWLIVFLLLPVFGYLLYMLWGRTGLGHKGNIRMHDKIERGFSFLEPSPAVRSEFWQKHPWRKNMENYLHREGFPLYANTRCDYFPTGEQHFEKMVEDMEQAESFIFLEYFIITSGILWDRVHDVLRRKAAQGVEVRILFDDFGSITKLPSNIDEILRRENIQVLRFNPVHRYIHRLYINYRNHQKITIIDGNIGYTGGSNIGDEYINAYDRYGYWKDTAIRLEGEAVWSLTVMFLQMWDSEAMNETDYPKYKPTKKVAGQGFFQPFADGPTNNPNNPAQTMYQQVINGARDYVYMTTPYLVIDNDIKEALCIAAKGGTDVRIVTPKKWDHWYVHMVTQSNYGDLLKSGIRIYEYTPGFLHAKMIISDDDNAIMGSINMDYRSFYLHFENGVWICGSSVLVDIKKDLLNIITVSEEIDLQQWKSRSPHIKLLQAFLRLFAPLL